MCGCGDIKYANRNHNHSNLYYTKREVSNLLDNYYTKAEVDALIAGLQTQIDDLQSQIDDCCDDQPQPTPFNALWPLLTSWTDTSGYSLSFTPQNGAVIAPQGFANFSGASQQHATLTDAQTNVSSSFTVAMYVDIYDGLGTGTDSYFASWYEYGVNNRSWRFGMKPDGQIRFVVSPDGSYDFSTHAATGTTALQLATAYHVAATFDATAQQMKIYLDGQLETTKSVGFSTVYQSTAPLMLAGNLQNGSIAQNFIGHIWQFRLIHEALSQAEIQALM